MKAHEMKKEQKIVDTAVNLNLKDEKVAIMQHKNTFFIKNVCN